MLGSIHERIYDDLVSLGAYAPQGHETAEASNLFAVLNLTRRVQEHAEHIRRNRYAVLQSSIGRQLVAACSAGTPAPASKLVGCPQAEYKLLANISDTAIEDLFSRSPLLITENDEPVGIYKGYGERTTYMLRTTQLSDGQGNNVVLPSGSIIELLERNNRRPVDIALKKADPLPISLQFRKPENCLSLTSGKPHSVDIKHFHPLLVRWSVFAIPPDERPDYIPYADEPRDQQFAAAIPLTSHDTLVARAEQLMTSAIPLEVPDLEPFEFPDTPRQDRLTSV